MVYTYAVLEETLRKYKSEGKKLEKLDLLAYDTDSCLVPCQNWADVGYFSPPIKAIYIERDDSLPPNYNVVRRDGEYTRGILYVVVDQNTARNHGINLCG